MRRKEGLDIIVATGEFKENSPAPNGSLTIKQVIERLRKLPDQNKFLGIYIENTKTIHYAIGIETDEHKEVI